MNARIHQGLAWIFAATIAGAVGCSASDGSGKPSTGAPAGTGTPEPGKPAPGKRAPGKPAPGRPAPGKRAPGRPAPGRERPGEMPADCFGPSTLSTAAREQLASQICASPGRRASTRAVGRRGGACADAYKVQSDAQIAGLLSAWHDAVIRESTVAERDAADPAVRDVAHLLVVGHTQARDEQAALFGRTSIQPEPTTGSRALDGAYKAECSAIAPGATFGREFVARQVEAEDRALQLVDALIPQAKNTDLRCSLHTARAMAAIELEHACFAWSSLGEGKNLGTAQSAETEADEPGDVDEPGEAEEPGEP